MLLLDYINSARLSSCDISPIFGSVISALTNLSDILPAPRLVAVSSFLAALSTALIGLVATSFPVALILRLIWGFAIVADSAQFSAAVSELCQKEYTGTALTLQTSLGFLLTLVTIRLVPTLKGLLGWNWAFAFLALGPIVGIWAMYALRKSPEAVKLAGGNR